MLISKEDFPKVALSKMNDVHSTEIDIVNSLYEAVNRCIEGKESLETVDKLFREFISDVKEHFSFEQELMEKYGFFAYPMHKGEHDNILNELSSIESIWEEKKDPVTIKDYLENHFAPWIINHVQTMDTVTAMFLSNFVHAE
ncbi:bacteriohemerythrin [Persephonella sp.]